MEMDEKVLKLASQRFPKWKRFTSPRTFRYGPPVGSRKAVLADDEVTDSDLAHDSYHRTNGGTSILSK